MDASAESQALATASVHFKSVRLFIKGFVSVGAGKHQRYALTGVNPLIKQVQRLGRKAPRILNRRIPARHLSHQFAG